MTTRRSSVAEDIAEITSRMPWWVGVVLAAVMTKGLATGGQYVLPIIFLLGSLVSGLRRLRAAPLRELYGVMAARGAAGGFVVTSGRFTDDARAFSNCRNLALIEGRAHITRARCRCRAAGACRGAIVSAVRQCDASPRGKERCSGRAVVLGLPQVPGMPGHAAHQLADARRNHSIGGTPNAFSVPGARTPVSCRPFRVWK